MTTTEKFPTTAPQTAPTEHLPRLFGPRPFVPDEHGTHHYQLTLDDAQVAAIGARDRMLAAENHPYYEQGGPWDLPGMLSGESGTTGWPAEEIRFYQLDDVANVIDFWTCQRCECDLVATAARSYVGDVVLGELRLAVWCVTYRTTPTEAHWVGWPVS